MNPATVTEPRTSTAPEHVLFYDAVCPFCAWAVGDLRRRGLLAGVEARPIDDAQALGLSADEAQALRSEMLVWSRSSGSGVSGFDGFLRLLELQRKWPLVRAAFRLPPLRALGRSAYRLWSYNRRILSPPANGGVACACDPPDRPRWRTALLAVLLGVALIGTFLFGMILSTLHPHVNAAAVGLRTVLAVGAGGVAAWALLAVALRGRLRGAFWQGLVVLASGIAILAPFALVTWLIVVVGAPPLAGLLVLIIGVAVSTLEMLRATIRRHRNLGFPLWAPWLWFVGLWAGMAPFLLAWA